MAAVTSGSFTTDAQVLPSHNTSNWFIVEWSVVRDLINNRSTVAWKISVYTESWWYNNAIRILSFTINDIPQISGTKYYGNIQGGGSAGDGITTKLIQSSDNGALASSGCNVFNHNADGTLSLTFYFSGDFYKDSSGYYPPLTKTMQYEITPIPRTSTFNTISDFNFEDGVSVTVNKQNSNFTDNLTIKIGSTSIATRNNFTTNTVKFSNTELLNIYNTIAATARFDTVTFTVTTKNGNTTVGSNDTTAKGTIKGTMQVKQSGSWKWAVPWVNINGTWRRTIAYTKQSNAWKKTWEASS